MFASYPHATYTCTLDLKILHADVVSHQFNSIKYTDDELMTTVECYNPLKFSSGCLSATIQRV